MVALVAKQKPKKTGPTSFGLRLRELRKAAGLTQAELGAAVEMPALLISRLETSPAANPTLATIEKLAAALKVPPPSLLEAATEE